EARLLGRIDAEQEGQLAVKEVTDGRCLVAAADDFSIDPQAQHRRALRAIRGTHGYGDVTGFREVHRSRTRAELLTGHQGKGVEPPVLDDVDAKAAAPALLIPGDVAEDPRAVGRRQLGTDARLHGDGPLAGEGERQLDVAALAVEGERVVRRGDGGR